MVAVFIAARVVVKRGQRECRGGRRNIRNNAKAINFTTAGLPIKRNKISGWKNFLVHYLKGAKKEKIMKDVIALCTSNDTPNEATHIQENVAKLFKPSTPLSEIIEWKNGVFGGVNLRIIEIE